MSAEAPDPTPEHPDEQIDYLNQNIANSINDTNESVWFSFGTVAIGSFSGFWAMAESLNNGSMRGGEIVLAAVSATSLFVGSVAIGDYYRSHRQLFELKKLKVEALKDPQG